MNKTVFKSIFFLLALLPFLSGCVVGPNYSSPCIEVPESWRTDLEEAKEEYVDLCWWEQFNDDILSELIQIALNENKDLLVATARVDEFLGLYGVTRSELYPQVGSEAAYGRELVSEKVTPAAAAVKNPDNIYNALLTSSWELDVWGKLRRGTEAARAELLATEEARQTVILTLVTAVASGYIDLLRLDRQLEITEETVEIRKKTLELFTKRHDGGVISKLELSQVESEYQDALATIPVFEKAVEQKENSLSILLGKNPGPIPRGGTIDELCLPAIPVELPSDLLCRRPDIREAESLLVAANARIGVAISGYFPTISLTGSAGSSSRDLSDLFSSGSSAWNYLLNAAVPIFTAGRVAGSVRAAEAATEQALYQYRQRVIVAFGEVEDSLIGYQKIGEQQEAQKRQLKALKEYNRLANLRYNEGYASYLEVLDANRLLFSVKLDYTETHSNYILSIVSIYKALGGGWICEADVIM